MALSAPAVQEEQQPWRQRLRNQLAEAVRSINWSYAIFWSISSTQPGVLVWTDGFYNGEVKTRKISNTGELTAEQLVMQRSEQLWELYEALLSSECNRGAARPVASLLPEDLGDTEWYYVVSMTYAFQPSEGLPGRSFGSNEQVWLCNAHLAGSKAFPRALLAKSASIKTIVCIPLMSGVLELGTIDEVPQDPGLVSRATGTFWELPYPTCSQGPSSNPSSNEAAADIIVFEHLDHSAMERMLDAEEQEEEQERGEDESLSNASLERITKEIDEFYALFEEMDDDVQPPEDGLGMDGSFEVPSSPWHPAPGVAANDGAASSAPVDGSRVSSFTAWTRSESDSDEVVVLVIEEPQKLLKKVVTGGAWANNGGTTTRTTQESGIKNHVMSERKRREKLNEMFLILKSMLPSIHKKVNKASILAETIAYVKELQLRVQELESSRELISSTSVTARRHDSEVVRKKVSAGSKRKRSELGHDVEREEHQWTLSKDGTNNVTVTVSDKEVLLEVQCRWEELLMTRVFDAIKSLHLDVLSVQAAAPDGFMGLKIRAQFAGSAAVVPWMISEAVRKAIGKRKDG